MSIPLRALCRDCGKTYRVPDAGRQYTCKHCGGVVAVPGAMDPESEESEESEESQSDSNTADETATCPRCEAEVSAGVRFCEQCGAAVGAEGSRPGRARRGSGPADRLERSALNREIGRGKDLIVGLRRWFAWLGGLSLIALVALIYAWFLIGSPPELLSLGFLVLLLTACETALYVVGYLRAAREPLLWTLVLALLETLSLGARLLDDPSWWASPKVAIVGVLWYLVYGAARLQRLLRENPDLRITQRLQGSYREFEEGEVGERARLRSERNRTLQRNRTLAIVGGSVVVLCVVAYFVTRSQRPPEIEPRIAEFTAVWSTADVDGLAGFYAEESRDRMAGSIRRNLAKRGWEKSAPALGDARIVDRTETQAKVLHDCGDGTLEVYWRLDEGIWRLSGFRFPESAE